MKVVFLFLIWLMLCAFVRKACLYVSIKWVCRKKAQTQYAKEQLDISQNSLFKTLIYGIVVVANIIAAVYLDVNEISNLSSFVCLAFTALISMYEALDNLKTYKDAKILFQKNEQ